MHRNYFPILHISIEAKKSNFRTCKLQATKYTCRRESLQNTGPKIACAEISLLSFHIIFPKSMFSRIKVSYTGQASGLMLINSISTMLGFNTEVIINFVN